MSTCKHGWADENYVKCPRCYDDAQHAAEVSRLTRALEEATKEMDENYRATVAVLAADLREEIGLKAAAEAALEEARAEVERLMREREDLGVACATIQCATHQGRDDFGCSTCRGLRVVHAVRSGRAWSLEHEIRQLQREARDVGTFIDAAISDRDHYEAAATSAEAEVSRLRGQVEGAWRAGVEAAARVVDKFPSYPRHNERVAARIRSLPPPSAPADDTDTNHKET